jgi:hypothetical protein
MPVADAALDDLAEDVLPLGTERLAEMGEVSLDVRESALVIVE